MKAKAKALLGSSIIALISPAMAQTSSDTSAANTAATETVVVTGSRIVRDGFESPTPVTVLTAEVLQARAPSNLPDALNQMPQFRSSNSNTQGNSFLATSPNSGNYLNLRGLGTQLSLILFDGQRMPSTSFAGGVDINTFSQELIQRVDIVTGGASAVYGSDAVIGVVNFVLDKNFTGIKASVQGGISSFADAASYKGSVAAGTDFDDGRGHIEGSLSHYYTNGIPHKELRPYDTPIILAEGLKTAASPSIVFVDNVRLRRMAFSGTILAGPLAGNNLTLGGGITPVTYNYLTNDPTNYSVGGNGGYYPHNNLAAPTRTDQAFMRTSYKITDAITGHIQISAAEANNTFQLNENNHSGSNGITLFSDNPYLAPSTVAAMGTTTSLSVGRIDLDVPPIVTHMITDTADLRAGLEGKFSAFGRNLHWDTTITYGQSLLRVNTREENNQRFYGAIDAIAAPAPGTTVNGVTNNQGIAAGTIICRVTLVNPGLLPGCVPMNVAGMGAPSQAAINYVLGDSRYSTNNSIGTFEANLSGTLFDLPAGPVSFAVGGEARRVTLLELSNASPAAAPLVNYTGIRGVPSGVLISNNTDVGTAKGAVNVKEGYAEIDIPVIKDAPLIQSLDITTAGRYTDYSTSGGITSWKLGFNYIPYSDVRVRGTLSRDIAAPTLFQLYSGLTVGPSIQPDPHTGITAQWSVISGGNPNLTPEKSYTEELGLVYTPSWLEGASISADYYHLAIKGLIGSTSANQEDADCDASNGTAPICTSIIRPFPFSDHTAANFPTQIFTLSQNQSVQQQSGVDFEAGYHFPLTDISSKLEGELSLHSYLTVGLSGYLLPSATTPVQQQVGGLVNPHLMGQFEADYEDGPLGLRVSERFTGRDHRPYTQGYLTAQNPQATILTDANFEPNVWYADVTVSYKLDNVGWFKDLGGEDLGKEVFLTAQNVFDQLPPIVSDVGPAGITPPTDRAKYDQLGRYVTVGVRLRY